jgi:Domain of unknown function (DUF4294)
MDYIPSVVLLRSNNMMIRHFFSVVFAVLAATVMAHGQAPRTDTTAPKGQWAYREIDAAGDTMYIMSLNAVRISDRRIFKSEDERKQYYRYMRAAKKVYPFAEQALALYTEIQEETADMKKRQRRKHIRKEHKDLKVQFEEKLKQLSRTEGRVLIKMIERETGKSFYAIIKETRGGLTAVYWHNMGKFFDYNLKDGYATGADPLLDEILSDYEFNPYW